MRIAAVTANLGAFDSPHPWVKQRVLEPHTFTMRRVTDQDFPPRKLSLSSRLQARIPKMLAWQFLSQEHDVIIWLDASFRFCRNDSVMWLAEQLMFTHGLLDIAVFPHPARHSIRAELNFIDGKIKAGGRYLTARYEGEDSQGFLQFLDDEKYRDDRLYASMCFAYRNQSYIRRAMWDWWALTARYHSVDQHALPYIIWKHGLMIREIPADPYHCDYIEFTRGKKCDESDNVDLLYGESA